MKKLTFTIATLLFICSYAQADIYHTVFGDDGWVIEKNENILVDVDQDGMDDFYINGWGDELGFVPIFAQGCFAGTGDYTSFGSSELLRMKPGQEVNLSVNPYFIDGDRGSIAGPGGDLAANWNNNGDEYIGFMVWSTGAYGWMRVSVDTDLQQLVIKEWAVSDANYGSIIVGDTGAAPVGINDLSEEINELSLSPNPAVDQILVSFNYTSDEALQLIVTNSAGIEVHVESYANLPNRNVLAVNTTEMVEGMYFLQLRTKDGVRTEKFMIVK